MALLENTKLALKLLFLVLFSVQGHGDKRNLKCHTGRNNWRLVLSQTETMYSRETKIIHHIIFYLTFVHCKIGTIWLSYNVFFISEASTYSRFDS